MTDEERKAWEELVECIKNGRGYIEHFMLDGEQATILAADAEMRKLREAVEWAMDNGDYSSTIHAGVWKAELRRRAGMEG